LEKLPRMSVTDLPLSVNVLVYAHASVGVFTRTPFTLSHLVSSSYQRMDGWMDGAHVDGSSLQLISRWMEHLWMPGRNSHALR
jgi:hypothetical protein